MDNINRSVNVKVLFFAKARETVGTAEVCISVNCNQTPNKFIEEVAKSYPELNSLKSNFIIAHNQVYIADKCEVLVLNENDEIALIPPISGG